MEDGHFKGAETCFCPSHRIRLKWKGKRTKLQRDRTHVGTFTIMWSQYLEHKLQISIFAEVEGMYFLCYGTQRHTRVQKVQQNATDICLPDCCRKVLKTKQWPTAARASFLWAVEWGQVTGRHKGGHAPTSVFWRWLQINAHTFFIPFETILIQDFVSCLGCDLIRSVVKIH